MSEEIHFVNIDLNQIANEVLVRDLYNGSVDLNNAQNKHTINDSAEYLIFEKDVKMRIGNISKESDLPTFIMAWTPVSAMICRFSKGYNQAAFDVIKELDKVLGQLIPAAGDNIVQCYYVVPAKMEVEIHKSFQGYLVSKNMKFFKVLYAPEATKTSTFQAWIDLSENPTCFFMRTGHQIELIGHYGLDLPTGTSKYLGQKIQ